MSVVGQCDKRVKAIVAWDNLNAIGGCGSVTIPEQYRASTPLHAPSLQRAGSRGSSGLVVVEQSVSATKLDPVPALAQRGGM